MTTHFRWAALAALCLVPGMLRGECRVWRVARNAEGPKLVMTTLATGQFETLTADGQQLITLVLALGEGQGADMVAPPHWPVLSTLCLPGDTLLVSVMRPGASPREVARMAMADLARWRIDVHIVGGANDAAHWQLDGWRTARRAEGPVLDLFEGQLVRPPGGYTISTIIAALPEGSLAPGRARPRRG
ncbi:MAG: hypothetical protein IPK12_08005 [Gemmatimonadetes bacterium]|nr:hypothetical protein [Gemmatimonadota bacterium]